MSARLVLVLGDLYIPDRAPDIPLKFKKLLNPSKLSQTLCLGNLTDKETYEYLRSLSPDLQIVKGDFDTDAPNLALSKVVTLGGLRIGFTHGHTIIPNGDADSLLIAARHMDVDVLLWGGTNRFEAYELEGKFFVNPGSATGAVGMGWGWDGSGSHGKQEGGGNAEEEGEGVETGTPSFCLMDVQGDVLVLYVYQLKTDAKGAENVAVEKVSFRKNGGVAA